MNRDALTQRFLTERERQFELPGREFDVCNSPNDWVAIVGHYLHEETRRGAAKPIRAAFEDSLVKAAAVLLAALEHCSSMELHGDFSVEKSLDTATPIT